jgi:hypothetical protein
MARNLIEFDDDDLRSLILRAVRILEQENLDEENRRRVERRYAIYISEAIRRVREQLRREP